MLQSIRSVAAIIGECLQAAIPAIMAYYYVLYNKNLLYFCCSLQLSNPQTLDFTGLFRLTTSSSGRFRTYWYSLLKCPNLSYIIFFHISLHLIFRIYQYRYDVNDVEFDVDDVNTSDVIKEVLTFSIGKYQDYIILLIFEV